MNAAQLIDDLIAGLTDWRGDMFTNIRKMIHEADPDVIEEWKWMGTPVWSHDGIVCIANPFKGKVKVTFFQGASLADPDKLFNNELTGKQWRSIEIFEDGNIKEEPFKALIREAVGFNQSHAKPAARAKAASGGTKKTKKP